jgi:hypothetical protein
MNSAVLDHERVVTELYRRLSNHPERHPNLYLHQPYFFGNRGVGEADLLSESLDGKIMKYYEVKGHYHPNNYEKALEQFRKFKLGYPNTECKFIYVSPQKVKRVYL